MIFVGNQLPSSSQKGLPCQAHSAWERGSRPQNPRPCWSLLGPLWFLPPLSALPLDLPWVAPLPPCPLDSLCPCLLSKWSLSSLPFERKLILTLLKISNTVQALQRGCGVMETPPPRRNAREKECGLLEKQKRCCSQLHPGGHAESEAHLQVCQASQATCCLSYSVWTSQLHNPPQLFLTLLLIPHLHLERAGDHSFREEAQRVQASHHTAGRRASSLFPLYRGRGWRILSSSRLLSLLSFPPSFFLEFLWRRQNLFTPHNMLLVWPTDTLHLFRCSVRKLFTVWLSQWARSWPSECHSFYSFGEKNALRTALYNSLLSQAKVSPLPPLVPKNRVSSR